MNLCIIIRRFKLSGKDERQLRSTPRSSSGYENAVKNTLIRRKKKDLHLSFDISLIFELARSFDSPVSGLVSAVCSNGDPGNICHAVP